MDSLSVTESVSFEGLSVPLFGHGGIWVEDSLINGDSIALTRAIMAQALRGTYPGQLKVSVYDEDYSCVAAPFQQALNMGGDRLISLISGEELRGELRRLCGQIEAVNAMMRGADETLVTYRRKIAYPVGEYRLLVLCAGIERFDPECKRLLGILLRRGPAAGVSVIIHGATDLILGKGGEGTLERMFLTAPGAHVTHLEYRHGGVEVRRHDGAAGGASAGRPWPPERFAFSLPSDVELIRAATGVADRLKTSKADPVAFDWVQPTDLSSMWRASSAEGFTFSVGRYGADPVYVTMGDELNQRHNALITGAVGQGKSNLLAVIVHSLCQRYSPAELQFYMLDMKEGVSLRMYCSADGSRFVPHMRALGLLADQSYALAVFDELFRIFRERMVTFKEAGVQSINAYRKANPKAVMPRIVVVIDEFQMMFDGSGEIGEQIGKSLMRAVRLFRASGIHFILASQTLGSMPGMGGASTEALYGQVPIRIALKNSASESRATLGGVNDAAAYIRAREAIVNLDYGNPVANERVSVAYADERVLEPLRATWQQMAGAAAPRPRVFDGDRRRAVAEDRATLDGLVANMSPESDGIALAGMRVSADMAPLVLDFTRDEGRSALLVGANEARAEMQAIVLCLLRSSRGARFALLDATEAGSEDARAVARLRSQLEGAGAAVAYHGAEDILPAVEALADGLEDGSQAEHPTYILGFCLDRCRGIVEAGGYGEPSPLIRLAGKGSISRAHVIGWWKRGGAVSQALSNLHDPVFDMRIAFKSEGTAASELIAGRYGSVAIADNRALVRDLATGDPAVTVIPYSNEAK